MQAVIFDMDGVLIDSEPIFEQHLQVFLLSLGIEDPSKLTHNLKGVSSKNVSRLIIETFELDYQVDELIALSRKAYMQHLNNLSALPSIPGAVKLVKSLAAAGHPLALASSASAARIDLFLKKLGLKRYFPVIACGDDVEHSKPAPDIFLLAAARLGVDPANCVVVEDAENGVQAAKTAGMKCIAYGGSEHNSDNLLAADIVVKDFERFVDALRPGKLPV
ncbi:HAD family phosphatase [Candidatus Saccharibacteria bacterium]|nr:MAG: HAD family phosphatase [Candidatus Saccharibacteria bacterium]